MEVTFRTVGGRGAADADEDESKQSKPSAEAEDEESQEEQEEDDVHLEALDGVPIDSMTKQQLRGMFGREALHIAGALFQHSSKICDQAEHLSQDKMIQITKPNGKKALYRKSQIHASTVHSALKSVIATSAAPITAGEAFVQLGLSLIHI